MTGIKTSTSAGANRPAIMATVADCRCNPDFLSGIFSRGASQVRVNSAHVAPEDFERMVAVIRSVGGDTPILMDTKGPEIRTTPLSPGLDSVAVAAGMRFRITAEQGTFTTTDTIGLSYCPAGLLHPSDRIYIDDALLAFEVVEAAEGSDPVVVALNDGVLGSRKSVNLPGIDISGLPSVTERDAANLRVAARLHIAMVAHSFVRSADDVRHVRSILEENGPSGVALFSKIECRGALDNFSAILEASDGVLVARGDLGMEIAPELIPAVQAEVIARTLEAGKPVIVATQFLNSMLDNPRPTRAEVADIAAATLEGASTLLLCGETAAGNYPFECVDMMRRAIDSASFDASAMLH